MSQSRRDTDGPLSWREHARLAKRLIKACGGGDEASRASGVSDTTLSRYAVGTAIMPADVIANLESYCGQPIYSGALFDLFDRAVATEDLRNAAQELTEASAAMQRCAREALADGKLTPPELDDIAAVERQAEEALERVKATRRAIEAGMGANIRAVSQPWATRSALTAEERALPVSDADVDAVLSRFGRPWTLDEAPKPTALDLWRAARIEYLDAKARCDTRAMGAAARKLKPLAMAVLAPA